MATTTYLRLFPAVKQFELKNGALNVGGRLFVYYEGTDDLAEIYDENGSRLQQPAILDNDGRALGLFVDAKKVYRLEVQDAFGAMQFTVRKMTPSGGGAGSALGKTYDVVSNDGSILVDKFDEGGTTTFDLSLGIDADELKPSCLRASAAPVTTDGQFVFEQLVREGNLLSVDGSGKVRMEPAWYHFTAIVELSFDGTPANEAHQVTLWTTLSNSVIDLDTSYAHRESIELSGDIHVVGNNVEFPLGVSGLDTGITASLMSFDIHAVTGHEGNNEYHAGEGITIVNATKTISADFDSVQEKLVAGENISITGNVISAGNFSQEQSDWTEDDTTSPAYIKNKPNLDQYATQAQLTYGLAGKQDVISDLAAIRSGAQAGASAVQPADLANVATTGNYNDLNNRPNLTVYATKTEVNSELATKQDIISDLSTIRSGAAAGATALQPSDVATVATTGDYDDLIDKPTIPSGAQLVPAATSADADKVLTVDAQGVPAWAAAQAPISAGDGISISNNVVSAKVDGTTVTVNASGELQAASAINVDQTYDPTSTNPQSGTAVAEAVAGVDTGLFEATYGTTTLSDIQSAISAHKIVYCRASGRMAFLAYIGSNQVEFQYYRSNAGGTGDSVFVYTVNGSGWTTTERPAYVQSDWSTSSSSAASYIKNKPSIPTKTSDLTNDSGFITSADAPVKDVQVDGASVVNAQGTAEIDLSGYATTQALNTGLAAKQDTISDLATIRSGAQLGASAVQPGDLATVATTGSYDDLVDKPTIPTVDQSYSSSSTNAQSGTAVAQAVSGVDAVPDVTSSDNGKVLVATYSGGTGSYAWATTPPANAIILDSNSTWSDFHTAYSTGRKDIYYKHTNPYPPFDSRAEVYLRLTAVSDVDGSSTNYTFALFEGLWNSSGVDYIVTCRLRYNASTLVIVNDLSVDQSYSASSRNSQSGVAVAQAISAVNQVPSSTSSDEGKVLTVDSNGDPEWGSGFTQVQSDWTESDTSDPSYIQHKPNLATVATTGAYSDLSGTPTINNVPAVTSSDNDKVLKASYSGGVGSYSWQTEQGGGSTYTAGDGIEIDNDEISVAYDSNTLEMQQQPPVSHTYDVSSITNSGYDGVYGETPQDIVNQLRTVSVTVHIPANTFYSWYTGNQDAVILFRTNYSDSVSSSTYCSTPLTYTQDTMTGQFWLDEQDVVITALVGNATCNYFSFGFNGGGYLSSDTWRCDTATLADPVQFSYTTAAGSPELAVKNPLPASTVSDEDKVLKVNSSGEPEWATGGGTQVQSDWTEADNTEPSYIQNKPVPKTLTAGTGISITENQSTITIANTATPPTVDQSYDASSTNAQSGVAVADAIGNLGTNLSAAQLLALKQALGVDETVLYEDSTGSGTVQLSEDPNRFERLGITYHLWNDNAGEQYVEVPANQTLYTFGGDYVPASGNTAHFFTRLSYSTPTLTCVRHCYVNNGNPSTVSDGTSTFKFYKVVGIHRIASN